MKRYLMTLSVVAIVLGARAQWECPSHLAANLDPIGNSPILIAAEVQVSTGLLEQDLINTAMAFTGVDISLKKHSFYAEGGLKAWWKYDTREEILFDQYRIGLRELFYQYRGSRAKLILGLQSSAFDDFYLLNERVAGANLKINLGRWELNANAGSVTKDFARNGIFCTTGFIYDLSTGQNQITLGNKLGDKNLAGFTFTYYPQKTKSGVNNEPTAEADQDEFSAFENDEFGPLENSNQDTQHRPRNAALALEKFGIATYIEFGDWIENSFYHTGLFASFKLPGNLYFKPEALLQVEESNTGIIYHAELEKVFELKSGNRMSLSVRYYGFSEVDDQAMVLNSYSNILAGEVLRLDAANMPLYTVGTKIQFPQAKLHIKFKHTGQLNEGDLKEWDLEIGKKFKNRIQFSAKGGLISGGLLDETAVLGRIESRFYF